MQRRQTLNERTDRYLTFQPGQRCADTVVDLLPDPDVLHVLAGEVQRIGVVEVRFVAVSRSDQSQDEIALRDGDAVEKPVSSRA